MTSIINDPRPCFLDIARSTGSTHGAEIPEVGLATTHLDTSGTLFAHVLDSLDTQSPDLTGEFNFNTMSDLSDACSVDENMFDYLAKPRVPKPRVVKILKTKCGECTSDDNDYQYVGIESLETTCSDSSTQNTFQTNKKRRNCRNKNTVRNKKSSSFTKTKPDFAIPAGSIVIDAGALLKAADIPGTNNNSNDKKVMCQTKGAQSAKKNREMKKQRMAFLEKEVQSLSQDKIELKDQLAKSEEHVKTLQREVVYLRNVISNQSCISNILKCLPTVPNMTFLPNNSSMDRENNNVDMSPASRSIYANKKRPIEDNDDVTCKKTVTANGGIYVQATGSSKRSSNISSDGSQAYTPPPDEADVNDMETTGGVCLHVSNSVASLEFCSGCAESAAENRKRAGDHTYFRGNMDV